MNGEVNTATSLLIGSVSVNSNTEKLCASPYSSTCWHCNLPLEDCTPLSPLPSLGSLSALVTLQNLGRIYFHIGGCQVISNNCIL